MRTEGTMEEWKALYETATRIRVLEPWKDLWDLDVIGVQTGDDPEDTVFYSVLGKGGDCYGIAVYEGYEGFNSFQMLRLQERLNLPVDYAMLHQSALVCYWGDREELSAKQRNIIRELGYKYRGKGNWLYFMSYEPGFYPYNLDRDQVLRMTAYLKDLERAMAGYRESGISVDFDNEKMFVMVYGENRETWRFEERPLPFTSFNYSRIYITDEEILRGLKSAPKKAFCLEADVRTMGARLSDEDYGRPLNPDISILVESNTGLVISCKMNGPEDDPIETLAKSVVHFIINAGAPKEIRVSNIITDAALDQICDVCGIQLRRVKKLPQLDWAWKQFSERFL